MDAFVIRAPSAGPSQTRDGSSSRRLPSSSAIPSFFAANKALAKPYDLGEEASVKITSHTSVETARSAAGSSINSKGKQRASTEGPYGSSAHLRANNERAQSVPTAHSSKLKQTVIGITASLQSADNPITHSSAYSGAFHYVSCSSGHQTNNGKSRSAMNNHMVSRNAKLKNQGAKAQSSVFSGVRAYINGTTMPLISNLDLIRLIQEHGGEVKYAFSKRGCSHIICVHGLSSQKTQKELTKRSNTKVVTPEWVLDSISQGKKLAESKYKILTSQTQSSIRQAFTAPAVDLCSLKKDQEDFVPLAGNSDQLMSSSSSECEFGQSEPLCISDEEDSAVEERAIVISSSQ